LVNYECLKDILDVDMDKEKIKTIDEYRKLNYISKFNATSSNDAYFTKSSIEYPRYAKIPFLPSIEEIEDSVAGTPAKPGIYSIINSHK
jgi:hypothetical protein